MAADGSIVINTRIDTQGFKTGATDMRSQFGKLGGTIGKLGAVIGAAFAIKSIIRFGKEVVELGSDLQEVQNVVDVTFTTMNDKMDAFAKKAAYTAGLSETMAKKFAGTYGAMAKSFGFAEQDAYNMSVALTQLTGDVASFYNLSQDLAYTKLKAVFSGETEGLKDLGVVMTQSALDAYALANGFGKTTAKMTEQEKVALRYKFILDKLSAASGDFIRTADGWANQTRILSLQFQSLKATIGQGLINLLTPVLKVINTLLAKLNTLAASFKAFTELITGKKSQPKSISSGYGKAADDMESFAESTAGAAKATEDAQKATEGYLSTIDEINKVSEPENSSKSNAGGGSGGGVSVDYGEVEQGNTILEKTAEELSNLERMFAPLKTAWSEYGLSIKTTLKNIGADIQETGKKISESTVEWGANLDFGPLVSSINDLVIAIEPFADLVTDDLLWAYENVLLPLGKWAIEETIPATIEDFAAKIETLTTDLKNMQKVISWIDENVLKRFGISIENLSFDGMDDLKKFSEFVSGYFSGNVRGTFYKILTTLDEFEEKHGSIFDYVQNKAMKPFLDWLSSVFSHDWRYEFGIAGNALNSFSANAKNKMDGVKSIFSGLITFLRGSFSSNWSQAWNGIKEIFRGIWESTSGIVRTPINAIIAMINTMIDAVVEGLNAVVTGLNSINVRIPSWVPFYGGQRFGLNLGYIHAPNIPYLATGAVIPPNAPFTAVLGDQKNGTNLEAPESLIRKIVREESGGAKGYTFVGQINRRVLFEEFISEAKLRQQTTGRNPFEFA